MRKRTQRGEYSGGEEGKQKGREMEEKRREASSGGFRLGPGGTGPPNLAQPPNF